MDSLPILRDYQRGQYTDADRPKPEPNLYVQGFDEETARQLGRRPRKNK